jgi:uncharacterized protein Veg
LGGAVAVIEAKYARNLTLLFTMKIRPGPTLDSSSMSQTDKEVVVYIVEGYEHGAYGRFERISKAKKAFASDVGEEIPLKRPGSRRRKKSRHGSRVILPRDLFSINGHGQPRTENYTEAETMREAYPGTR